MPPASPGVIVVGGGVVGCAVARRAARGGLHVLVVERARPGAEASSAAAGMLSPLAEAPAPGPFLDLLLHARALFPAFAAEILAETGVDVGYGDAGTLFVSLRPEDDAELEERWAWQSAAGLAVERLTAAEALALEPALNPALRFALRFPGDHQVDNRLLSTALWRAAEGAGVSFRLGAAVAGIVREGDRVVGVELEGGERIEGRAVVVAGGCWSGGLRGLPRPLPVEPVYGQLVAVDAESPPFRHVVDSPRCYLVPRAGGRVIVGATVEHVGYRRGVSRETARRLLEAAAEIAPGLARLPAAETWSGLRPGTPDGMPVLGEDPDVAGLFYATGHFRNGILLAPLTGEVIGGMLLGEAPSVDLSPYSVARFG